MRVGSFFSGIGGLTENQREPSSRSGAVLLNSEPSGTRSCRRSRRCWGTPCWKPPARGEPTKVGAQTRFATTGEPPAPKRGSRFSSKDPGRVYTACASWWAIIRLTAFVDHWQPSFVFRPRLFIT